MGRRGALALGLVLLSTGCLHRHRKRQPVARRYPPPAPAPAPPPKPGRAPKPAAPLAHGEEGIASWYGHPYHGRPAASGEIYNMYAMTAAHRTLPFGTRVRVHNLENGMQTEVRINDRGPFVEGRIIDLSYKAAQMIHMPGTALVRLEILAYGETGGQTPPAGTFAVQVGAFKNPNNARRLKALIEPHHGPVTVETYDRGDGIFYRVRVGRLPDEEAAQRLALKLKQGNFATETFVVRLD